ncbi:MAG: 3'-5' exoribonuclease [Patescibacteria group bacterium]|nr:3'-5' exoribonuclease [Patescibacteria group bacterium]
MKVTYISVDIEASGPTPGRYSMLSIGTCVVGDTDRAFYVEIQPISNNYVESAMKIACLHLDCLPDDKRCKPNSPQFSPRFTLLQLRKHGTFAVDAMREFNEWVREVTGDTMPIFASDNPIFDGMFVFWYFDNFYRDKGNPFGHSGLSMNSFVKGLMRDMRSSVKRMKPKPKRTRAHNALADAIYNAQLFQLALDRMRQDRAK